MSYAAQGLYDPAFEHDACGLGFVAHIKGTRSHDIVARALGLLDNLSHRGAVGCDPCTGDGSGVLIQLPHYFLARAFGELKVRLGEPGTYGIGMMFLPSKGSAEETIEGLAADEGLRTLGWRDVSVDPTVLGDLARQSLPVIRQVAFTAEGGAVQLEGRALERRLYVLRRRIERLGLPGVYVPSLS
ncbi:MAG TPA: hypothetical protein VNW46_00355, partial [Gemmatimonadaceae bacterium]|nr:hypothetical protein [Gemmatimonadaceae bacterium]